MQNAVLLENVTREELIRDIRALVSEIIDQKLQPEPQKDFLTKKEVSAMLRISLPTLQRMTQSGSITGYRMGRRILYRAAEVDNALKTIETIKYKRN
ncbi:MAG: helix-turn-helix domain-containing protein [Bacteroidia bacterium]|nr:helix-turn-helix domain-containing protein [Bacteroidia bacterium]